jgi:hypothetical protein
LKINGKEADFDDLSGFTSGDLKPCIVGTQKEPIGRTIPATSSTLPEIPEITPHSTISTSPLVETHPEELLSMAPIRPPVSDATVEPETSSLPQLEAATTAEVITTQKSYEVAPESLLASQTTYQPPTPIITFQQASEEESITPLSTISIETTTLPMPSIQANPFSMSLQHMKNHSGSPVELDLERYAFVGLCDAKTCGEHGSCEELNFTHVVCHCRDFFVGPSCQECECIERNLLDVKFRGNIYIYMYIYIHI